MNPSARIKTVMELLEKTGAGRIPMDAVIGDVLRHRRYIGAKDRAAVVETVYAIVRAHARLEWHMARAGIVDSPRTRVLAWLALADGRDAASIEKLFDGSKYGPVPLEDAEKEYLQRLHSPLISPDMPESVSVECPPQYEETLRALFGHDFAAEMTAMMEPATLDLRINTRLAPREKVLALLREDGVDAEPTPLSPWGLRVKGKAYLAKTRAFVKGWIDIQDEGSQLAALACGAQPGMQVLDYCAGGGGKTLALAAAMANKGRIVAMDTESSRLEKGRQRFRRAGVSDIIEVRPLSDEKNRKWLRRQKETFDIVLTDVPCTGTGTWRRNPDTRWRNFGPSPEDLLAVQADILDRVAKTVKPGGRLVYVTCSLLPAENEAQIAAFTARHPEFSPALPPEGIPHDGLYMRLTPRRHGTDGFFAAVLVKGSDEKTDLQL